MNLRLAAGIAIAFITATAIVLATVERSEPVQNPEVLSNSVSASPTTTTDPANVHDLLPDESPIPQTPPAPTPPASAPSPTPTTSPSLTDEEASTTTTPPPTSTTTLAPTTTTTAAQSGGFDSSHENSFAAMINSHRSANGLAPLPRNSGLDAEARAWSQHLAAQGTLSHSDLSRLLPPWTSVGENVAVGGSVTSIFGGLAGSSGHNSNMLGDFSHIGIGVWVDADGTLWTTHIFAK